MQQLREICQSPASRRALLLGSCVLALAPRSGVAQATPALIDHSLPLPGQEPRAIWVHLPLSYSDMPSRRYPLLLLLDGQNMFSAALGGSPQRWRMEAALRSLPPEQEPIVAAVAHGGVKRIDEYTPWPTEHRGRVLGGAGAAHAQWLVQHLLPFIHQHYRTLGPAHTAAGGSSLAGLMALWLLRHQRQAVSSALAVSPSVWWAQRRILQELEDQKDAPRPPQRLWIDVGTGEGEQTVADARALRDTAARLSWPHRYLEAPGAEHNENAWAARAETMLRYLYGP